jgi:hypothetical protein
VPWYAKTVAGAVAAYALSPIALIPDFISEDGLFWVSASVDGAMPDSDTLAKRTPAQQFAKPNHQRRFGVVINGH